MADLHFSYIDTCFSRWPPRTLIIGKGRLLFIGSVHPFLNFSVTYILLTNMQCLILIYIQQHAMLHSLFYLETALHVSGGTTTHHQERKQLYLQHLVFVTPLLQMCDKYQML